ncbi:hypothetical protein Nocox_07175 [Nonomuraea coxensis DSM 45129]|uniref:Secreted protein n=1 Tax=Nonomuraea coxensis DSM 45129 TaxID=1122611 RepID=A0ABX8TUB8_9ACTN|nr:hypothetical protein [Nonomuraea coxensis]QYC39060.1 hypothetical protein Nocox_07175 [Nonomuraea coxensis DSM 45129]
MKKIAAVAGLVVVTAMGGPAAAGDGTQPHDVSQEQYRTLISQCRYADTAKARARCRAEVRELYRVGRTDKTLDCRTYSGITVCGTLRLNKSERACVRDSVAQGLPYRRAEVECYALT